MSGGLSNLGTLNNYATEPYCSVSSFRSAPTWIDSTDLIPGGTESKQDFELFNVLMRASSWADLFTGGTAVPDPYLGAASYTENSRQRVSRWGEVSFHPHFVPIQSVTSISMGSSPLNIQPLANISQIWIEDSRQIFVPVPGVGNFSGLQFGGSGTRPDGTVFVEATYVAGYFNSSLAASTFNAGSSSLTVVNPSGLNPGTPFRINDPSAEEVVTVAPNYTIGSATVPLVSPTVYTHTGSAAPGSVVACSALPLAVQQAVICYAVGLLMREDVSSESPFGGTPYGPSARRSSSGGAAAGLIYEAEEYLMPFRRVR